MNKIRSVKTTLSLVLSVLCVATVLTSAAPSKAQQIPVSKTPSFHQAVKSALNQRWENWKALRDPLLEDKKALLAQVREKYKAKIKAAASVQQAKALRKELDTEGKKISAFINDELEKAMDSVNKVFVYNVEQICEQYGEPIPRWLARFRTK